MLVLAACGGGGGAGAPPTSALSGTLAYVASECRVEKTSGYLLHQVIQVRQADREPITVMEVPDIGPVLSTLAEGRCILLSSTRFGPAFANFGAVQRLAVSTDGETVAFELSDDFSTTVRNFLPDALKGIWVVRADGSGLRRLGPPSRQASWVDPPGWYFNDLTFSPDGGTLTFPDLGTGPDGTETSQIFLQDVATEARAQITDLPAATPAPDLPAGLPSALAPFFLDDETVAFATDTNIDGTNPQHESVGATVKRDGSNLKAVRVITLGGGQVVPIFFITGGHPQAVTLTGNGCSVDVGRLGQDARTQAVVFYSSCNPLGTNPNGAQIFVMRPDGSDLRQLTTAHGLVTGPGTFTAELVGPAVFSVPATITLL